MDFTSIILRNLIVIIGMSAVTLSCASASHREWNGYLTTINKAAYGGDVKEEKLREALDFFEELASITGVSIDGDTSGFLDLWFPNDQTYKDLKRLDEWYKLNRHRMRWNAASKTIVVESDQR